MDDAVFSVGGVTITGKEAFEAIGILEKSGTSAIRAPLAARGSPLARCDYHAVYAPGMDRARAELAPTGRAGTRGRHLAKQAFCEAVMEEMRKAACAALRGALAAISGDERYATAVARDASALAARRGWPRGAAVITDRDACHAEDAIAA